MGYSCRMWTPGLTATENVVEALLPVIDGYCSRPCRALCSVLLMSVLPGPRANAGPVFLFAHACRSRKLNPAGFAR
jgi:hypothetical protein